MSLWLCNFFMNEGVRKEQVWLMILRKRGKKDEKNVSQLLFANNIAMTADTNTTCITYLQNLERCRGEEWWK